MSNKGKNFYEELNLSKDCRPDEIKKSFIKLSKEYHPDKTDAKDAHERFVRINEAYKTLSNPLKRRQYDQELSMRRNYDFNASKTSKQYSYRSHDFRNYQYTHKTDFNNSYSGSRILFRLALLPKAVIFTALVLVTIFSSGLEVYFLKNGVERNRRIREHESMSASLILEQARNQAKLLGNEEQMRRMMEGKLGVYDSDDLVLEHIKAKNSQRYNSK